MIRLFLGLNFDKNFPMSITDIMFNAAGGGILGSALHCFTDWLDTKNKIALMNAQVAAAEKTEAWKAFAASQGDSGPLQVPQGVWPWVSSFYVLIFALKEGMRPILCLVGGGFIIMAYQGSDAAGKAALASEIVFGAFTAWFWYFGARYSRSQK